MITLTMLVQMMELIIGLSIFVIHYHSYVPADWATNFFITLGFCSPLMPQIFRMEGLKPNKVPMDKLSEFTVIVYCLVAYTFASVVSLLSIIWQVKTTKVILTVIKSLLSLVISLMLSQEIVSVTTRQDSK